jgi:phosphate transport system substrate-binding protein
MKANIIILLVVFLAIIGCNDKDQNNKPSLPTRGRLVIGIDESLRPVAEAEIRTFSIYYPNTDIEPLYLPEKQVIEKFLANEIQTGIICRELYDDEIELLKANYNHLTTTFKLGEDAIVLVANNSNPVNDLSYDKLKKILSGEITGWEQIDPVFKDKTPIVAVITRSSSVDRYFSSMNDSPITSYALDSTNEVIDYVQDNISALGILGGSWFYQKGNKYSDVKLLGYINNNPKTDNQKQGLFREVFAVTHEPFTGLGSGFISFLANEKGQLILSKAGMTPFKPINREIQLSRSFRD